MSPGIGEDLNFVIIANSVFPYGYDAARILGLPDGSPYRARFDELFVSEQVRREFPHLEMQRGYYCFRDYGTNRLIPLRNIEIVEITLIGSVYYIEYTVGELFDFPHNQKTLHDQVASFNDQFFSIHKNEMHDNQKGRDLRPLVLMSRLTPDFHSEVETVTDDYDKEARRWVSAVKLLGEYSYFKYVPFLRVVALRGVVAGEPRQVANSFVLRSNEDYRLQIAHNLKSDSIEPHSINEERTERQPAFIAKASFRLELRADARLIDIQEPRIYITGEYDVSSFYFRTREFGTNSSTTTLTVDYIDKPPSVKTLDTKISLTMLLKASVRFPTMRFLSLLALVAIYAIPHFYPVIFQYLHVDERILQDVTIVAVSLTSFHLLDELRHYAKSS
jgi:hypothetical protein